MKNPYLSFLYISIVSLLIILPTIANAQNKGVSESITKYAEDYHLNGSILVQKDKDIIYQNSFGLADRSFDIPIQNETIYKIASITKAFTAVLILQLRESGKIDLNKTIDSYLPDYTGEAGSKVTIHQLLNHTSGMRQTDTISSITNALKYGLGYLQKPHTSDELLELFESDSLVNQPGENWDYNNYEYVVLGKIIEAIYGKPYEEVLSEKILVPTKMANTGVLHTDRIVKNLANTYFRADTSSKLMPDFPVYMENWYASGSLYSNTNDLLKFSNALFHLELINSESLNLMLTPGLEEYGYGVWIRGAGDFKAMERYGRIAGANAVWFRYLNKDITVIILSNTNLTDLGEFASYIGKEIMGKGE